MVFYVFDEGIDTRQYITTLQKCHIRLLIVASHCLGWLRMSYVEPQWWHLTMQSDNVTKWHHNITIQHPTIWSDIAIFLAFVAWNIDTIPQYFHSEMSSVVSHGLVSYHIITMSYCIVAMSLRLLCVTWQAAFYMALMYVGFHTEQDNFVYKFNFNVHVFYIILGFFLFVF